VTGSAAAGSSQVTVKYCSSNQQTTSASYVDVTFTDFSVAASTTYTFRAVIYITNAGGNGAMTINGPSSPTSFHATKYSHNYINESDVSQVYTNRITTYGSDLQTGGVYNTSGLVFIDGVLINGANAGTLTLRIKKSGATSCQVNAGSFMTLYKHT
jgi:hypothetical protein